MSTYLPRTVAVEAIRLIDLTYRNVFDFLGWPDGELEEGEESWEDIVDDIEIPAIGSSTEWASTGDWIVKHPSHPHEFEVLTSEKFHAKYEEVTE